MIENAGSITAYQPLVQKTTTEAGARAANGVYKDDANLVSLWLFENGADLGEDSVGSNDLTNSGVTQNADQKEGTYSGDWELSDPDYMSIADNASLSITGDLTVCFWVKFESVAADNTMVCKYNSSGDERSYYIWTINSDSDKPRINVSSDGSTFTALTADTGCTTATWYHLAFVVDVSTDIRIYRNGSLDCTPESYTDGSIYDGTAPFALGIYSDLSTEPLDGLMDEVAVFNRVLSADEISDIHTNGIRDVPADVEVTSALYPAYHETLQTEKEKYVLTDGIGFDSASFTLTGSSAYLWDWFEKGLVRHIVWLAPDASICWEGYVHRLRLIDGDRSITKTVEGMANRVHFNYTALDTSTNPPTTGAKTTITVNDTASQDRYGIKTAKVSGSDCTAATADDRARAHLEWLKYIASTEIVNVGQGKMPSLLVECKGYAHMANWNLYAQTTSSGTANANVVLAAILTADPNTVMATTTLNIETNTTATEQYWAGDDYAWKVIQELAARGQESGSVGYRWHVGVYEDRRTTFKPAEGLDSLDLPYSTNAHLAIFRESRDQSDMFTDEAGREVRPWEIKPDRLLYTKGAPGRPLYLTKVTMTMPWRITFEGTDRTNPRAGILTGSCGG